MDIEHLTILLGGLVLLVGLWATWKLVTLPFALVEVMYGPFVAGEPDMVMDHLHSLEDLEAFELKTEAMRSYPEYDSDPQEIVDRRFSVSESERNLRAFGYVSVDQAPEGWKPPRRSRW